MKKSRFTDSQIIAVLKQAEAGTPVPELCREYGISSATFYKWRSKFGGMDASLMSQLKELQDENRRLKKMYAEAQLSADLLKEAMSKKWCGHLNAERWPDRRWKADARASGMRAGRSRSARPAFAIRPGRARRTPRSPTGWCG